MDHIAEIAKAMSIKHNVTFRVLDNATGKVVQEVVGHNQATNTMLTGIAHYLIGDGVLNQGREMLSSFVPRYISLGTMGILNQDEDDNGLPIYLGRGDITIPEPDFATMYTYYMSEVPGYGADGYDRYQNNGRMLYGLGMTYSQRVAKDSFYQDPDTIGDAAYCELISDSFPRADIVYREIIPETRSEVPETIDVVLSAMISTGALAQFRNGRDHIFITEAGLWSKKTYLPAEYGELEGTNGFLAGYRIVPPNKENWDMSVEGNREILKQQILRVGINQVVQVIWKIQLGSIGQLLTSEPGE